MTLQNSLILRKSGFGNKDVYVGSTPHPATVKSKGLEGSPTKNVIILVVIGIWNPGWG